MKYAMILIALMATACGSSLPVGSNPEAAPAVASSAHNYIVTVTSDSGYALAIVADTGSVSPGPQTGNNTYNASGTTLDFQITKIGNGTTHIDISDNGASVWSYTLTVANSYTSEVL